MPADRTTKPIPHPFEGDGVWLRCALHAHTTNSDGDLPPEKLVAHYERAGYDVLAITDHWVRTDTGSTRRLIVIPSVELNAQAGSVYDDSHVLGFGITIDPVPPENEFAGVEETVKWILDAGGVPYVAHPVWSGLRAEQYEEVDGLVGVEIWNTGCEQELGRGDSSAQWDEVLEHGRLLWGIASDDSHHPGFDSRRAWTWVRAAERSAPAVLAALRDGMFYSSTGPQIHALEVDTERVVIETSPAASITLYAGRQERRARHGRAGRVGEQRSRARTHRRRARHRVRVARAVARAVRPGRGRRRRRPSSVDEPALDLSGRARALEELTSRDFDLLVVGGGIIGAGIAAAAARHGLAVALVERGDFGGETSSASSKLVHGGLRYLRLGDVGLVREAHAERHVLMTTVAPHLVRPLPFLLPLYDSGPYRPTVVQAGIALYSTLARARLNGLVPPERAQRMVPDLRTAGLRRCGLYVDCSTNDSRLTLANVRAAADAGATVLNGARWLLCGSSTVGSRAPTSSSRKERSRCRRERSSTPPGRGSTPSAASPTRALSPRSA